VISYVTQAPDTTEEAERQVLAGYRAMQPHQKVHLMRELVRTANTLALSGIRMRHPRATDRELRLRLAALRLPAEIMERVFGWSDGP
jgi:hypothetical protein